MEQGRQWKWSDDLSQRLLGLDVRGPGGGQWQLIVRGMALLGAEAGIHGDANAVCRLDVDTFAALIQGQLSLKQALLTGAASLQGNGRTIADYSQLLEQLFGLAVG